VRKREGGVEVERSLRAVARMSNALRVGLAGFVATAVAYGPARTGYGLFVPDFRGEFGLSTGAAGAIGSGLQAGFLLALVATVLLVGRLGPRLLVAAGGITAIVGMLLVAFSPNATTLAAGVLVAGMTAGFCWSPYNDLAGQTVRAEKRARVLSAVSTGTTLGIGVSGLVALAAVVGGLPWRAAWLAFVAAAVLSAFLNALLLPGMPAATGRQGNLAPGRRDVGLFREGSAALFAVALSFGVVNAFYWSFNADIVSSAGLPLPNAGPILYAVLGAAGFAGLLTGDLVDRFGLERTLRLTLLCLSAGAVLLGLAPGSLAVVGASAVLYGAGVMFMSTLLSLWSSAVFEERPSEGFTAALIFFGVGGVVGPAALGTLGGAYGLRPAFAAAAALILLNLPIRAPKKTRDGDQS
jgi:predicted MFS family arabinose efflux permease